MERIPIAMAGTGGMARRQLKGLLALQNSDHNNVRLVAVYGRTLENAEALADEAAQMLGERPAVFTDIEAMTAALPDLRGVTIVTDAGSHPSIAVKCLRAGLHVLIEKPLALTVQGCNQIINAARENNLIVSVAENYRRDPINRLASAIIESGAIGERRLMQESRIGGGNRLFITPWRHQKNSGTVVMDTGVHNADILQYYMGDIDTVYGEGRIFEKLRYPADAEKKERQGYASWKDFYNKGQGVDSGVVEATGEDALFAYIRFTNGAIGQWTFHFAAYYPQEYRRVVFGGTGTIVCPGDRNGRPIIAHFGEDERVEGEDVLQLAPDYHLSPLAAQLFGGERIWTYSFPYAEVDAKLLALELYEFGDCVLENKQPEVTGEVGRRAVALVNAVFESGLAGRAVTLDEIERGDLATYQYSINEHYANA